MLAKFLGSIFVVLLILAAIAYASGWIQVQSQQESTTIEMKTGEMKDAADKAVEKGKDLIEKAGEKLKQLGDGTEKSTEDKDREKID